MIKTVAYVDRMWGDVEDKQVYGDMGFSICETGGTISDNVQGVLEDCREWSLADGAVDGDDIYQPENGTFAIYEVYKADIDLENEDDFLWMGVIIGKAVLLEVNVCATKEVAGWIEERYKGVTINYRKEE